MKGEVFLEKKSVTGNPDAPLIIKWYTSRPPEFEVAGIQVCLHAIEKRAQVVLTDKVPKSRNNAMWEAFRGWCYAFIEADDGFEERSDTGEMSVLCISLVPIEIVDFHTEQTHKCHFSAGPSIDLYRLRMVETAREFSNFFPRAD